MSTSSHFAQFAHHASAQKTTPAALVDGKPADLSKNTAPTSSQASKPTPAISTTTRLATDKMQQLQQPAPSPAPKVSTFIKREAEDNLESILAKPEPPHLRRLKIFNTLATNPTGTPKLESKTISSPENLTDYELKECYDIARAAMSAQFQHRKCNPAMMEDFLKGVFEDWNALEDPPILHELKVFPFSNQGIPSKTVIGTMKVDRETVNVQHWFTLSVDNEVSVKIEVVRPAKHRSRNRVTIKSEELRKVMWEADTSIETSKLSLRKQALITLVNQIADYNRERAVRYARIMLHHQAQGTGTPAPCSGRYEFAELNLALKVLPLLEKDDLEQGDQTVVLFSTAELDATFKGKTALKGKKTLKASTG